MKVEYSKQFVKVAYKLTGKYKISLQRIIAEVKQANDVADITDCVMMVGFQNSYRIKMGGSKRADAIRPYGFPVSIFL